MSSVEIRPQDSMDLTISRYTRFHSADLLGTMRGRTSGGFISKALAAITLRQREQHKTALEIMEQWEENPSMTISVNPTGFYTDGPGSAREYHGEKPDASPGQVRKLIERIKEAELEEKPEIWQTLKKDLLTNSL